MSDITYKLPLTPMQFVAALHKGQGRALVHVRKFGLGECDDAFVDACLHDKAFDPQWEGDRSPWLMKIMDASGAAERIVPRLIPRLDIEGLPSRFDAMQRGHVARELAQRGYEEGRALVYAGLRRSRQYMDVDNVEAVIRLDGADGLLHVAEYLGKQLEEDPEFWVHPTALHFFDETHGAGSAYRLLKAAAEHSPLIAGYLAHLEQYDRDDEDADDEGNADDDVEESWRGDDGEENAADGDASDAERECVLKMSAAEVVQRIEAENPEDYDPYFHDEWCVAWSHEASDEAFVAVFAAMVRETRADRLSKYMQVFNRRALPVFDPAMLRYADHHNQMVRDRAHEALSNYAHPDVRRLALERVKTGRIVDSALKMFEKNYQPGDAALIARALRVPENRYVFHEMIGQLFGVFELHPGAEWASVLLFIYEEAPCSECRFRAVKAMIETGTAPAWLIAECQDDSLDETRELVGGLGRSA